MSSGVGSGLARVMAWSVGFLTAGFILYGLFRYGLSWETHARLWRDVLERVGGPMSFRFILQPTMAAIAALHDGIQDARTGRPPFLRTVLTDGSQRSALLNEELYSTSRIILLGFVMDAIYQWRILGSFYPVEAIVITLLLAVLPYLILRGPVCRIARFWFARHAPSSATPAKE